jgi:hypothetical protein
LGSEQQTQKVNPRVSLEPGGTRQSNAPQTLQEVYLTGRDTYTKHSGRYIRRNLGFNKVKACC